MKSDSLDINVQRRHVGLRLTAAGLLLCIFAAGCSTSVDPESHSADGTVPNPNTTNTADGQKPTSSKRSQSEPAETEQERSWVWRIFSATPFERPKCREVGVLGQANVVFTVERFEASTKVCFTGVTLPGRVSVELIRPSGEKVTSTATASGVGVAWSVPPLASDKDLNRWGVYQFRLRTVSMTPREPSVESSQTAPATPRTSPGTQALSTTAGSFEIIPTRNMAWRKISNGEVVLGGLRPGTPVRPSVFGPAEKETESGIPLREHLPTVVADENGEATIVWTPTGAPDPGSYGLWVDNGHQECGGNQACAFATVRR